MGRRAARAANSGGVDVLVHAAAKTGMVGFTRVLALEWAPYGIQVNAISPGMTYTQPSIDRERDDPDGSRQRLLDYVPAGRYGQPEEIAELAFFLATTTATYLHGENIVIDGGYTIH